MLIVQFPAQPHQPLDMPIPGCTTDNFSTRSPSISSPCVIEEEKPVPLALICKASGDSHLLVTLYFLE
ncbi:hypothetical protein AGABI1DRAFT_116042 [Agaricus bisporus var. burnettii JB137-S8]|uniref:Uncharacterized protein n=1 Tax=Agaricus bisporus var. burnettii (strain JB137-S8 / ATCC MYA-4627 / FGSC 10392) TaxID=597362 RepID=K5WZV9_AGABU|nr:uncharacterized protein AGABI1DRAFT_116042 [Agaricus bisporus var. burnettii JB137-S8]EKM76142.1 hypothetical protein AGABI1DRAFT_116042 [Agaricus bisporus var. burnettii JB137-S8]